MILGGDDVLVPVESSVVLYERTARMARRSQKIVVFPGADHRLHNPISGELAAGYLSELSKWVSPTSAGP